MSQLRNGLVPIKKELDLLKNSQQVLLLELLDQQQEIHLMY
jgi:hypothetical protein